MNNQTTTTDQASKSSTRQYLTIAVVLLLLAIGISMTYKSCAPNNATTIVGDLDKDIISEFDNHPEDQTLTEIIEAQESEFDEEAPTPEEPSVIGRDEVHEASSDHFKDKGQTTVPKPIENNQKTVLSAFMVISGSYRSLENARKGLEHTILSGFENAEIVQFNDSKYHTVCALRSDNEKAARAAVAKLRAKKIDAFLHVSRLGK